MPVLTMTATQAAQMVRTLRTIAKELSDTALGSSRAVMYNALAGDIRLQAQALEDRIR